MEMAAVPGKRRGRLRRRLAWAGGALAPIALAGGGYLIANAVALPTSTPSCSWPLRVHGRATSEQAGLIRCYLRALARHDAGGLLAVADTTSAPVRITAADFRHSADARSGLASARFVAGQMDDAYAVTITFGDGAREIVAMGLANPGSVHSWRLGVGTSQTSPGGPPPAQP
ncbi:MAG TPA: hypothetical protein VFQ44_23525 [Streptosporangiaceae bacterium]|nr:hypothetical protein [Streptosporangiaceae bacterium]